MKLLGLLSVSLLLLSNVTLLGCGPGGPETGTVSGTVSEKGGAPLTEGVVNFYSKEKGAGGMATIDGQGAFKLDQPIPTGTYAVFIAPPPAAPPAPGQYTSKPNKSFTVAKKYRDAATSDLKAEVKAGENTFTFELDPK